MDEIESHFDDVAKVIQYLIENGQVGLSSKMIRIAYHHHVIMIGSYFENKIYRVLANISLLYSRQYSVVENFIIKTSENRYHSMFDWNTDNANRFFGQWGKGFSAYMKDRVSKTAQIRRQIEAFMVLGQQRNLIAHEFKSNQIVLMTPLELAEKFRMANAFVDSIQDYVVEYTDRATVLPMSYVCCDWQW